MKMLKKLKPFLVLMMLFAAVTFVFYPAISKQGKKPKEKWVAPESAKKIKNPTTASKENLATGKSLYMKNCKACHGAEGKGDGPKSKELDTDPGSFASADFQKQTDGELFYKTKEGKDDMPTFKKKIANEEDIWLIIDYVRTLK